MRVAILSVVLGLGATSAVAETRIKQPIVWDGPIIEPAAPEGWIALTNVSRTLFINDCKPSGCTVSVGADNSINNTSSIPQGTVVLPAYPYPQAHWDALIKCVKETFHPFTIDVVTTNPGTAPHFEVMVGGADTDLRPTLSAGGVAPYISCNAQRSNGLSFVFPETTNDLEYLCGAVVQEAMHVWGMDHELDAKDPMTYLQLGSLKRFQNNDASCGEDTPRNCRPTVSGGCGGSKQNSFKYMINTFGLNPNLEPPGINITSPKPGAFVKPGFKVEIESTGPVDLIKADVKVGTMLAGTIPNKTPYELVTMPTGLPIGKQTITVAATDFAERPTMATVDVEVLQSCAGGASCADGKCLGGTCFPDKDVKGGLGSDCATAEECATGKCIGDGTTMKCTEMCDPGNTCPDGYDCIDVGGAGLCWPQAGGGGGGCSTGGSSSGFALFGLGVALLALRQRAARRASPLGGRRRR